MLMNTTSSRTGEGLSAPRVSYADLSPSDRAFNLAIDKVVAWMDRWFIRPLIGAAGEDASDF